jgi:hypothetical protein
VLEEEKDKQTARQLDGTQVQLHFVMVSLQASLMNKHAAVTKTPAAQDDQPIGGGKIRKKLLKDGKKTAPMDSPPNRAPSGVSMPSKIFLNQSFMSELKESHHRGGEITMRLKVPTPTNLVPVAKYSVATALVLG